MDKVELIYDLVKDIKEDQKEIKKDISDIHTTLKNMVYIKCNFHKILRTDLLQDEVKELYKAKEFKTYLKSLGMKVIVGLSIVLGIVWTILKIAILFI